MKVYMDNSSTTQLDKEVFKEMKPYFIKEYGNPSSFHLLGQKNKEILDSSKEKVAKILNCSAKEIIFTGSGTESCNLAIKGLAFKKKKGHIISQRTEHHAVLHSLEWLEKQGYEVTYLEVNDEGLITAEQVENAIKEDTILVSIMYANNEIGTIFPIKEISTICQQYNIPLHVDACQVANTLSVDVEDLGVDMLTLNGSKIYGPKGVGILYVKQGIILDSLIHGGQQEFGKRAGTENIPNIVGFAKALEIAQKNKDKEKKRLTILRNKLIKGLLKISDSALNGPEENRLANNVNISFRGVEGESLILYLNELGIYVSTGSACSSKSLEPSHVLKAIGRDYEYIHGSVRFSLGKNNTIKDVEYVLNKVPKIVEKLRLLSPIYNN